MSEPKITITVPFTTEESGFENGTPYHGTDAEGRGFVGAIRDHKAVLLSFADIGVAILRAWPGEQKVMVASILPEVAAAHRTERAVDFAEIEAWLARFEDFEIEDIADMSREDLETDIEVATTSYVPALLDEVLDAERALTAAGIPGNGRPLAERIAALQAAKVTGVGHLLRRTCVEAARVLGAEVDPTGSGEAVARALREGIEAAQAALRAAKVLGADGTLGEAAADILRAADMLRRVEHGATVEHRCADPATCPLCMAVAETDPAPQTAVVADPLAGLTEEQRQHLIALASDPAWRARFNGSTARIAVLNAPTPPERHSAARMREYINGEFGLTISVTDLATALGISEADMLAIEAGTKSTDAAGWTTMQTACFLLGSGKTPSDIADPMSSPAFQRAMEREEEPTEDDAPEETDPAGHSPEAMWSEMAATVPKDGLAFFEESFGEGRETWSTPAGQRFLREMRGGLNEHGIDGEGARLPLTMIVAIARNGVIGKGAGLPWRIPEDLRHFKRETMGHTLIVGRKTAETLPPLDGRRVVVVSKLMEPTTDFARPAFRSIEDAIKHARSSPFPEPFIAGGAEVYRAALPFVTRILLTEIDHDYEGDVRFELDRTGWRETSRRAGETPGVSFVTLERKTVARSEQIMEALHSLPLSDEPPTEE